MPPKLVVFQRTGIAHLPRQQLDLQETIAQRQKVPSPHGGLRQATKRRLASLAHKLETEGDVMSTSGLRLKPGAKLVREWHGDTHSVLVLEDGFEYRGKRHRSLSKIARAITGAHWSGPRFFGLAPAAKPFSGAGEADHE